MTATDIALNDAGHRDMSIPVPAGLDDPTGGRLVAWANGLAAAHRIANALCQTSFAPAHFRGKPDEAAAAILYGDELGFSPTQALQNIFMIGGRPGMYARQMAALVMSRGHQIWTIEKTDTTVTVAGCRRGAEQAEQETWTIERARKAGYTTNKKYETDPASMLYARALGDVCRRIAPDVLAGLAYAVEELEVIPGEVVVTPAATRSATQRLRDRMTEATQPAPLMNTVQGVPESADIETGEAITDAQRRALFPAFKAAGFDTDARTEDGKAARLAYVAQIVGRDVASTSELTAREASILIDALREDALATASGPGDDA